MQAAGDGGTSSGVLEAGRRARQETILERVTAASSSSRRAAGGSANPAGAGAAYQALTPEQKAIIDHPMMRR